MGCDEAKQLSLVPTIGSGSLVRVKTEECSASSSSDHLESSLVKMGFQQNLVQKVIAENGEADAESLIDMLCTYSTLQGPGFEDFDTGLAQISSEMKMKSLDDSSSVDFSLGSSEDNEEDFNDWDDVISDKREQLLSMKFSEEQIDCAIARLGENSSREELIEFIICPKAEGDVESSNHNNNQVPSNDALFGTMNKTLQLLDMGFSENDVADVIDNFGGELPVQELADSIFAQHLANMPDQSKHENAGWASVKPEESSSSGNQRKNSERSSSSSHVEDREFLKKRKIKSENCADTDNVYGEKTGHSSSIRISEGLKDPKSEAGGDQLSSSLWMEKEKPSSSIGRTGRSSLACPTKRPYFVYASVAELSTDGWNKLSHFVYKIRVQLVDTGPYSALKRTEGYIHNLPVLDRAPILPQPPKLIKDVFPDMNNWWPTWDTRKQMTHVYSETMEVSQSCKRLEKLMMDSQGILSEDQRRDIVSTCERYNLTWLGAQNLGPFQPEHIEQILGYPLKHTDVGQLRTTQRLKLLKGCLQTDTLGYHLSFLKRLFPNGLNLLSMYSGIGGAEVTLQRLGIRLKAVLSVESSKQNREIIRSWWSRSRQTGELVVIDDIKHLRVKKLEDFFRRFGDIDLVVFGNPCSHVDGEPSGEVNYPLFYEALRVLERAKALMAKGGYR